MKNNFYSTRRIGAATFAAASFCRVALFAQTNATEVPLKLTPPYAELPPTFWEQDATAISLVGLAAVVLLGFAWRQLFRPKPETIIPPEVAAREALQPLSSQPEDGAVLSCVSQALRHYFIAAFQLAGDELTPTEFNREMARSEKISPELSAATAEFLRECDARKFSSTTGSEKLAAAKRALNLVEQAEQRRAQLRQLAETPTPGPRA